MNKLKTVEELRNFAVGVAFRKAHQALELLQDLETGDDTTDAVLKHIASLIEDAAFFAETALTEGPQP